MPDPVDAQGLSELPLENLVACHECDLLMRKPELAHGEKALCPRCGYELYANRYNVVQRSLALVIAALLLFIPANFLPIMQLRSTRAVFARHCLERCCRPFDTGMQSVSVIVFLCSMGIPLLKLLCQLAVLLSIRFDVGRSYGLLLYRIYHHIREWGMLEVYFMGVLVAIVKLADMAAITVGLGLVCFIGMLLIQVWLEVVMSPHQIWQALSGRGCPCGRLMQAF